MKKLHSKFSALNVDFDGPILDFLGSRKPAHKGSKERYLRKSRYFIVVGQSSWAPPEGFGAEPQWKTNFVHSKCHRTLLVARYHK